MKQTVSTFAAQPSRALTRTRLLPVDGEVLVSKGDAVNIDTVVARARIPGRVEVVPVGARLGIPPHELERSLAIRDGEPVEAGQLLAEHRGLWGLSRTRVLCPASGVILSHSAVTGTVIIEGHPTEQLLRAFVQGTVRRVFEKRGVVIEGAAAVVQAVVGVGPDVVGPLVKLGPQGNNLKGSVVFIPGRIKRETLTLLASQEAAGAVAGSVHSDDLMEFLGRSIDPASTVDVETPLTLAFTEGFGDYLMSKPLSAVLESLSGRLVGLCGRTQVRAGALRPELVAAPRQTTPLEDSINKEGAFPVRIVRGPDFGKLGRVVEEPRAPVIFESGIGALAYVLELEDGRRLAVPRVNIEKMVLSKGQ